jgi:hypothetical protein
MRYGFCGLFARICKILRLRPGLFDPPQRETKPATRRIQVASRGAEIPVTEELRHVSREDTCLFEPGRGFVTKISELEILEAGSLASVPPRSPDRFDTATEPVAEGICLRRKRLA